MTVKNSIVPAGRSAAVAGLAAIVLGFAGPAFAQQPAQGAQKSMPPPATVYEDAVSGQKLTFEKRNSSSGILKLEGSSEVMALRATPAQRGDTYWTNDAGEPVLRETEQGSVTSFLGSENGSPAAFVGYALPVAPPPQASLELKRVEVVTQLSKLAGHEVTVFGTQAFGSYESWAVEALDNVIVGAKQANGPAAAGRVITRLTKVRLELAKAANVTFKDGELVLFVNPGDGYAGRPSSEMIAKALTLARNSG
jgi:hypothetical protein